MSNSMKRFELVFVPSPGIGHLTSTVKFATQLLDRDDRFSITVLVMRRLTHGHGNSNPLPVPPSDHIRYVYLPILDPPPMELFSISIEAFISVSIQQYKTHVKNAILNLHRPLAGLVLDMFCTSMIDLGNELGLPSYIFFTSGTGFLSFMFYLENRYEQVGTELEESDADFIIPGFTHPVPSTSLPSFAFNKKGGCTAMVKHAEKFKEAKGIIINTFAELESHALSSLSELGAPPIYTVGPILDLKNEYRPPTNENRRCEIMTWLDDQPPSSVVFLCFGSRGSLSEPQIKEIAKGLENSGKSFLWSIRRPPQQNSFAYPSDYDDYSDILPDGFSERIRGKGMLCGWVPQVDILAHRGVGGFVSHCGWNSTLESIWHGVPMAAWPLYAEQHLNAFQFVKDLGLAVEMKLDYKMAREDLVYADEIERAVRRLMEDDNGEGDQVRKKVKEMSRKSREAFINGGSSYISLGNFIDDLFKNISP